MITRPTVLVLGAGASTPFGYPAGKQLKKALCEQLSNPGTFVVKTLMELGYKFPEILPFYKALIRSGTQSIDAFLEHRTEYIEMGKIAITRYLATFEKDEDLFRDEDWYGYLFGKLNTSFEGFSSNRLSIITFNYDRSLERYLFTVMQNLFSKTDSEIASKLKAIPIIHVYGQIGYLPWQDIDPVRPYEPTDNSELIKMSSDCIRIVHEDTSQDSVLGQARILLQNAEKIYFLGFGYHPMNIQRLDVPSLDENRKEIFGTSYNLTDHERTDIMTGTGNKVELNFANARYHKVLDFMREHISFN